MDWVHKYGSTFAAWIGNVPYVIIAHAPDVEVSTSSFGIVQGITVTIARLFVACKVLPMVFGNVR